MRRAVTMHVTFTIDDCVTDDEVMSIVANAAAQVIEPVVGWDDDGNEILTVTQNVATRVDIEPQDSTRYQRNGSTDA